MTRQSEYDDNNTSKINRLLEQYPPGERERMKKIWEMSSDADAAEIEISRQETEDALSSVHKRIGSADKGFIGKGVFFNINSRRWIAAAAAILFIFAGGVFLTPQTVKAPYGEIVTATLPDGSSVELNSGSRIWYSRLFTLTHREIHLDGEAYFSVVQGQHPFEVDANGAYVKVTGTQFNVRSWSGEPRIGTEVGVTEGEVLFSAAGNPKSTVTIGPGQWSRLTITMDRPARPEPVEIDRITGWRDRKLIFNNSSLAIIFKELERMFDVKIEIANELSDQKLTTYYADPDDPENIIQDICRVQGLRYAKTANGYRIYR